MEANRSSLSYHPSNRMPLTDLSLKTELIEAVEGTLGAGMTALEGWRDSTQTIPWCGCEMQNLEGGLKLERKLV